MTFDITLLPELVPDSEMGNTGQYGRIQLRDHVEEFVAFIGYWSPHDYLQQWRSAVRRLVETRSASCLITSVLDPSHSRFVTWWLLYPAGDRVLVQNQLLILDELDRRFEPDAPYAFIPDYTATNEEGLPISQWELDTHEFVEYLERQ